MAASKHLGIRDAVATLFAGLATVHENRDYPLPIGVAKQIGVYRVQSIAERVLVGLSAPVDWATDVRTVIKARANGATSAEAVADALAVECYSRVMADQSLGGLCDQIEPGAFQWDQDEGSETVVMVTWDIRIAHRTEAHSIA